jgi:hypothetical protein
MWVRIERTQIIPCGISADLFPLRHNEIRRHELQSNLLMNKTGYLQVKGEIILNKRILHLVKYLVKITARATFAASSLFRQCMQMTSQSHDCPQ